jgi:RNA polymerase sigma factor (sigma-70 family)
MRANGTVGNVPQNDLDFEERRICMLEVEEGVISDWPTRLQDIPEIRDAAIRELRVYLVRGLEKSLSHRYGGRVDVDDIAQVAILRILDSLKSFARRSRFETWAMAIATRVGISELRKRYYKTVSLDAMSKDDGLQFELPAPTPYSESEQQDRVQAIDLLQRMIDDELSDRQRLAIRGILAGLSIEIVAERLGSNRNAVYKLVHDARSRLRKAFEEKGYKAEDILALLSRGKS